MSGTMNSAVKASIGAGVLVLMIGGGTFAASALNSSSTASTAGDPPAVIAAPSSTDPVYVQRGDVTVGHIRQEDLNRPRPVDQAGVVQEPGEPDIGYSVYDDDDVLVGYDTPHYGFVHLDEVDRYKADPMAFVRQRALDTGIPVPEGY